MSSYYNYNWQTSPATPTIATQTTPEPELRWWIETPTDDIFAHFATFGEKLKQADQRHIYIDNGADVLAVAHLDTVQPVRTIKEHGLTEDGEQIIKAHGLDDRLGAYAITHLLPFPVDLLYTDLEEVSQSTAQHFTSEKNYRYVMEFDRAGIDVVTYDIDSPQWLKMLRDQGATIGRGSFTDLCYLDHGDRPECMVNYGTGYYRAHSPDSYANLDELREQVALAAKVHAAATATDAPAQWLATNDFASNRPKTYSAGRYYGYNYGSQTIPASSAPFRSYDLTNRIREAKTNPEPYRQGHYVTPLFDTTFVRYCAACGRRLWSNDKASTEWPFCNTCDDDLSEIAGYVQPF